MIQRSCGLGGKLSQGQVVSAVCIRDLDLFKGGDPVLDLIVLGTSQACASGQCPQQAVAIVQPQVVVTASPVAGPSVIKYRRNIFGKLVPVQMTVNTAAPVATSSCSNGKCR